MTAFVWIRCKWSCLKLPLRAGCPMLKIQGEPILNIEVCFITGLSIITNKAPHIINLNKYNCCHEIRTSPINAQCQSMPVNADQNCVIDSNTDQYSNMRLLPYFGSMNKIWSALTSTGHWPSESLEIDSFIKLITLISTSLSDEPIVIRTNNNTHT